MTEVTLTEPSYTEQEIATASMTELAEYTDVWTLVDGEGNLINTELANYTEHHYVRKKRSS